MSKRLAALKRASCPGMVGGRGYCGSKRASGRTGVSVRGFSNFKVPCSQQGSYSDADSDSVGLGYT